MNYLLRYKRHLLFLLVSLALVGCGASGPQQRGDPAVGKRVFSGEIVLNDGKAPACATCHAANVGEQPSMGLNMSNVGNRAATRVPEQSAEVYLRTAIIEPDAYLAGGFQEGIMYRDYGKDLSPQQVDDLVAYLLSLRSGQD